MPPDPRPSYLRASSAQRLGDCDLGLGDSDLGRNDRDLGRNGPDLGLDGGYLGLNRSVPRRDG